MSESAPKRAILQRRMAFVGGTLAMISGCPEKNGTTPQPLPTDVVIGDPSNTSTLPTAGTAEPSAAPPAKIPPRPSTAIPETTCAGDRTELDQFKKVFDEIHAEIESIYESVPTGCLVTDDACVPKYKPLAKRYDRLEDRVNNVYGLCGCHAPIVGKYISAQQPKARERLSLIRKRIITLAKSAPMAGQRWDALVQQQATPRPCLSCVPCDPKSACD